MRSLVLLVSLVASLLLRPALAFEGKPKFGPNAVPILQQTAYLRAAPAPDYWKLNPFYVSQTTASACSVASITMAINVMLGLPASAEDPIVTQASLLTKIGDTGWAKDVAEGGRGVTFAEFVSVVNESLAAFRLRIMPSTSSGPWTLHRRRLRRSSKRSLQTRPATTTSSLCTSIRAS